MAAKIKSPPGEPLILGTYIGTLKCVKVLLSQIPDTTRPFAVVAPGLAAQQVRVIPGVTPWTLSRDRGSLMLDVTLFGCDNPGVTLQLSEYKPGGGPFPYTEHDKKRYLYVPAPRKKLTEATMTLKVTTVWHDVYYAQYPNDCAELGTYTRDKEELVLLRIPVQCLRTKPESRMHAHAPMTENRVLAFLLTGSIGDDAAKSINFHAMEDEDGCHSSVERLLEAIRALIQYKNGLSEVSTLKEVFSRISTVGFLAWFVAHVFVSYVASSFKSSPEARSMTGDEQLETFLHERGPVCRKLIAQLAVDVLAGPLDSLLSGELDIVVDKPVKGFRMSRLEKQIQRALVGTSFQRVDPTDLDPVFFAKAEWNRRGKDDMLFKTPFEDGLCFLRNEDSVASGSCAIMHRGDMYVWKSSIIDNAIKTLKSGNNCKFVDLLWESCCQYLLPYTFTPKKYDSEDNTVYWFREFAHEYNNLTKELEKAYILSVVAHEQRIIEPDELKDRMIVGLEYAMHQVGADTSKVKFTRDKLPSTKTSMFGVVEFSCLVGIKGFDDCLAMTCKGHRGSATHMFAVAWSGPICDPTVVFVHSHKKNAHKAKNQNNTGIIAKITVPVNYLLNKFEIERY